MRHVPTYHQTFEEACAKQEAASAARRTETCEQRRARQYGIEPRDVKDPTDWNAHTIEREADSDRF